MDQAVPPATPGDADRNALPWKSHVLFELVHDVLANQYRAQLHAAARKACDDIDVPTLSAPRQLPPNLRDVGNCRPRQVVSYVCPPVVERR